MSLRLRSERHLLSGTLSRGHNLLHELRCVRAVPLPGSGPLTYTPPVPGSSQTERYS